MDPRTFPTKGNLILAKNSLALANQGYELMDKKRNILIRELMELIDQARTFRNRLIPPSHMHINACSTPILNTVSVSYPNLPIPSRLRILSRLKAEALWERKFHLWITLRMRISRLTLSVQLMSQSTVHAKHFAKKRAYDQIIHD